MLMQSTAAMGPTGGQGSATSKHSGGSTRSATPATRVQLATLSQASRSMSLGCQRRPGSACTHFRCLKCFGSTRCCCRPLLPIPQLSAQVSQRLLG